MSYQCEQCKEQSSLGDSLNVLIKILAIGGIAWMAYNYKNDIKEAIAAGLTKAKAMKALSGPKQKRKKSR